ncbi:uncharacterized protein BO72DRAFT_492762 [Aspergillus fijiensis CBS 313.89]|uniref:Uncharacterized protein n=1 Tax=Aspergillus fijiensis CBS 313.89 TaxID=1448319 RepID=A0A8G1W1C1_9EURO|nr:uncharacterized protein BO72DRAFT_492762 [Aspergillus fijiensis CBS 313.89]RAK80775.1 hypothetical protein BO72DRAFT_492762 [Aspergillus fijiensis CBS 313.89]
MPRKYHPKVEQTASTSTFTAASERTLRCTALLPDGKECPRTTKKPEYQYCRPHHQEHRNLHGEYKRLEEEYNALLLGDTDASAAALAEKIARGTRVIALRDEVNRRFFSVSQGNRNHVRWILKLKREVNILEERSKMGSDRAGGGGGPAQEAHSGPAGNSTESETPRGKSVYRSLLSPDVPMSDLEHLPDDSPARALKTALVQVTDGLRQRLYNIVPSLDDSSPVSEDDENGDPRTPDVGDKVIRFLLRELILWKADTEVLTLASEIDNIDTFLRQVPWEVENYIKFFETLGREDTLHLLRDALCDCLLPPDSSGVRILGERIRTDNETRKMTVEAWDVLHRYFPDYADYTTVDFFCFRFEDVLLIRRLMALQRYSPQWYGGACEELPLLVFLGFIPVTRGYQDPLISLTEKDGVITATQNRCYLVGRISKHDAITAKLVQDLLRRVAHYIVVVYETSGDGCGPSKVVHRTDMLDDNPWVKRSRSADTHARLDQTDWSVEWSLDNIRNDVRFVQSHLERNMVKDYVEILIIDRHPGRMFSLHSLVSDALTMILHDPSEEEIMRSAIRKSIPEAEQTRWIDACSLECASTEDRHVGDVHYEGARVRAWDVQREQRNLIRGSLEFVPSLRGRRLICKILDQMEASGIISRLTEPHKSYSRPILLHGTDGLEDLYFHYDFGPVDENALALGPLGTATAPDSLSRFARAFQAAHPGAIFAKGRVNVHYCAWPMAPVFPARMGVPTFHTSEGYVYRWNVLPFDFPLSQRVWQGFVNHTINKGVFYTATPAGRQMRAHRIRGSVLLVASMSVLIANKGMNSSMYNSS